MTDQEQADLEQLGQDLETHRLINDRLTELLEDEVDRRTSQFRAAEGIPEPAAGDLTNMDELAMQESTFEQDNERCADIANCIDEIERRDAIRPEDIARVQDLLAVRVDGMGEEMERSDVDQLVEHLGTEFDVSFLR